MAYSKNFKVEDLGNLTEEVINLKNEIGFLGMNILQFAFDSREKLDYMPHNYTKNSVVYTGTHDNDTIIGWCNREGAESDLEAAKEYLFLNKEEGYNWGVQFLVGSLSGIFSGQMLAINFYTKLGKEATTLASVLPLLDYDKLTVFFRDLGIMAYCLPFQSMYYTPISILTGIIDTPEKIIFNIMLQVMWLIVLNLIADIMWKVAQKKITILGG